jgi:hypothetical protein
MSEQREFVPPPDFASIAGNPKGSESGAKEPLDNTLMPLAYRELLDRGGFA